MKGKIILLNGVSSAGKSTLAKVLQARCPTPLYRHAIDDYLNMLPQSLLDRDIAAALRQTQPLLTKTVALFSDWGMDCVIDHVMLSHYGTFADFVSTLRGYPVLMVRLTCSVQELRRREIERGDREPGHAESQLACLEPQSGYDLVMDTSIAPLEQCADRILTHFSQPETWRAFETFCRSRAGE